MYDYPRPRPRLLSCSVTQCFAGRNNTYPRVLEVTCNNEVELANEIEKLWEGTYEIENKGDKFVRYGRDHYATRWTKKGTNMCIQRDHHTNTNEWWIGYTAKESENKPKWKFQSKLSIMPLCFQGLVQKKELPKRWRTHAKGHEDNLCPLAKTFPSDWRPSFTITTK